VKPSSGDVLGPPLDDAGGDARAAAPARDRVADLAEQRIHIRFDKLFPVVVDSELFGEAPAIARNISRGGMLVEMASPLPLGAVVSVHFRTTREDGSVDEIIARAEVKHHYCLNFAGASGEAFSRAVGLRFIDFDERPSLDGLTSARWLH
jgi:hypothetical protein